MRQLDWSEPLAPWLVRHSANCLSRYRIQADGKTPDQRPHWKTLETSSCRVWRESSIPTGRGRTRRTHGRRCGENDGWHFRWSSLRAPAHHCSLSERGLLRGARDQRKTADQQWDNEFVRKGRGVPWMLTGEEPEPEVRPPQVLALVMPAPKATVRAPQQRRRCILKQDVARCGPTPGCEASVALAGGSQRATKPHSDECRARMDELMQRDEDALVQQRLHADTLNQARRSLDRAGDERRNPHAEAVGSNLLAGSSGDAPRVGGAQESTRTGTEAAGSGGGAPRAEGADEPRQQRPKMPM